jgi:CubicO group peptidase (beta-lactamase class C family)
MPVLADDVPPALDDAAHVEMFMDGVINTVMYQRQIPGAVLIIVKDGQLLLSKGYGYSDAEKKTPILPDRTLFRIASVSKTINATAVMQLVEQGKLDLNGEANDLLKRYGAALSMAEHYPQKIRLLDLIDHTAGFDERAIGMAKLNKAEVPALGAYLADRMPPQVMEPRTTISYSNHGVALAGYLVELASGDPYASYVRDHVFAPLGMTHSSMEWNETIAPDIAQGYQVSGGNVKAVPFDNICIPPAGGMLSSGTDMAQFMIAHLQNGRLGDTRILQESTAIEMHRKQYEQDPRLEEGIAVGFFTGMRNGHRYIEHGGDLNGFASELWMLPDDGIGIFTSGTTDDGTLRGAIVGQFMDRYFPDPAKAGLKPNAEFANDAKKYAGKYRSNRFGRRSIEKLTTLMEQFRVTADDKGSIFLGAPGGDPKTFIATGNGVFVDPRNGDRAVFRTGNGGEVTHMLLGSGAFERLKWYEESIWHFLFIGAALLLFASAAVCWPAARVVRKKAAKTAPAYYRLTAWFFAAVGLFLLVMLGTTLMNLDKWEFTYGMPQRMTYLLMLPPVLALGSAVLAVNTLAVWWRGYWPGWSRLHYTLVAAACAGLVPFFLFWNLLGFNW